MEYQYVLVENKQTILLGPIWWKPRFIQSELNDLEVNFTIPISDPCTYIKINDSLEIYPIDNIAIPSYDSELEDLAGPYWNFENFRAYGHYNSIPKPIEGIKNYFKSIAADERYKKEIAGIEINIQDTIVSVSTDRDARNIYSQKLLSMESSDTIQWKFPQQWLTLSKQEMQDLFNAVNAHVQTQYDWEASIVNAIESSSTPEQIKSIQIRNT